MTHERLQVLLAELADPAPDPRAGDETAAALAWVRARQVRRRRATWGAAAAVLLVAVPVALLGPGGPEPTGPDPTVIRSVLPGGVVVDQVPATLETDTPSGWPAALEPPDFAPTLSQLHGGEAILMFQPLLGADLGSIYLWRSGANPVDAGMALSRWVRLDVDLADTIDEQGNPDAPLDVNSLGPGGRWAAFAQPDAYVVVDLTTADVTRTPLPGFNQEITWYPDGEHLLVSGANGTTRVGRHGVIGPIGFVGPVGYAGTDVAVQVGDSARLAEVDLYRGLLHLRWFTSEQTPVGQASVDPPPGYPVEILIPRGWRTGHRIAQAVRGDDDGFSTFILVIEEADSPTRPGKVEAHVTHVLDLGPLTGTTARVVGWLNADTVLVHSDRDGVLAWRLIDGRVTRALPHAYGRLSIALPA